VKRKRTETYGQTQRETDAGKRQGGETWKEREKEKTKIICGWDIKVGQSEGRKRGGKESRKDRWGAEREEHREERHSIEEI
jgi:hypothetical protein